MATILLIYPAMDQKKAHRFGVSLNLLYLSSILKDHGHTITGFLDMSSIKYSTNELDEVINRSEYIIIEIDSYSLKRSINLSSAEKLIEYIGANFISKKVVVFGYDLSLKPRNIQGTNYSFPADKIQYELLQLLNGKQTYIDYNKNYDELPFPDRSIVPDYIEHGGSLIHKPNLQKSTIIQTSKGCLNTCTFCQRKGWQKSYITHSVDYVVSEFRLLKEQGYINIWIADDNFTFNLSRAKKILTKLIELNITKNMKISCSSWTKIDYEFLDLAKQANVSIISFGIESADSEILNYYKKDIDLSYTEELIRYANNIGLYTVGNFIIGAPMETDLTINKTFNYALKVPFDQVNVKILDYMIGAELYNGLPITIKKDKRHIFACKENGLNQFNLLELKSIINSFKILFNRDRSNLLKVKIQKIGEPYKMIIKKSV